MAPTKTKRPGGHRLRSEDTDKAPRIEKMRGQGKTWGEIADALNMTPGRAQFILLASQVKPKDRIKFTNDADLGKKITTARDTGNLSWPLIAARTGVTEGRVKDIYRRVKEGLPPGGRRGAKANGKPQRGAKARGKAAAKKTGRRARAAAKRRGKTKETAKDPSPS